VAEAAERRRRLVDYILRTVRPTGGKAVVVDLGWGCTIQVNLEAALAGAGAGISTLGLYLLTNEGALERMLDGVRAEGFLGTAGFPDQASWITRKTWSCPGSRPGGRARAGRSGRVRTS